MKKLFTIAFMILLWCILCPAQNIANVTARQEGSSIVVSYDIDKDATVVNLTVSTDGGRTFSAPLKKVSGDVNDVSQGHRQIVWDALSEWGDFSGSDIVFNVVAIGTVEYVDLGLSVLWATCNIGASEPQETGRYFAWGDVVGQIWDKESKTWSGGGFSKAPEFKLDANNQLKEDYDAAHIILGGQWRMPTIAECQELIKNSKANWETNYKFTGVDGFLLTSKKRGYTDKSIFFPYTGYGKYNEIHWGIDGGFLVTYECLYWTKTPIKDFYDDAIMFVPDYHKTIHDYRYYGVPIRPVMDKK